MSDPVVLGKLQSSPLKEVWPGEATHFTPWLAENIETLGDKLGIELVVETVEAPAGDFSADIVAVDLSSNRRVVIENQFGNTDHKHLGQLITYSSVLNAGTVVWIAETIRPEHKSAIDFLNQNLSTNGSLKLYAIEASLIRIDGSNPAFVLNLISSPPPEPPNAASDISQQPSETREKYRSYFQNLIDTLRTVHHFTNAKAGQPQNWYSFSSDSSKIYKYGTSFTGDGRVMVEIYIDSGDKSKNENIFDYLLSRKSEIEAAFGGDLSWNRLDARRACRIAVYIDGNIDEDSDRLAQIAEWSIENLIKFKKTIPKFINDYVKIQSTPKPEAVIST